MNTLAHVDRLERQILELHSSLGLRTTLERACQLGEQLAQAKKSLPHGDFLPWTKRLPFSYRSAAVYMQVFEHAGNVQFSASFTLDRFIRVVRSATRPRPEPPPERVAPVTPDAAVYRADCRRYAWPGQCDVIAADPPWQETWPYDWLPEFAAEHLREGGVAIVQCGQADLADRLARLTRSGALTYCWTLAMTYEDVRSSKPYCGFVPAWRPVVLLSRGERVVPPTKCCDVYTIRARQQVKDKHRWQQPLGPLVHWYSKLVAPGARYYVPFAGAGTEVVAAVRAGGTAVGTEVDPAAFRAARQRCRAEVVPEADE